jgi:hypothetical protein
MHRIAPLVVGWLITAATAASAVAVGAGSGASLNGVIPAAGTPVGDSFRVFEIFDDENPSTVLASGSIDVQLVDVDDSGVERYEYQITNDGGSANSITTAGFNYFGGFGVDADFRDDSAGTAPNAVSRSADGETVTFSFAGTPIAPGTSSRTFYVQTNALQSEAFGYIRLQVGTDTEDLQGFFTPAPEPNAIAACAVACGALLALRSRRECAPVSLRADHASRVPIV